MDLKRENRTRLSVLMTAALFVSQFFGLVPAATAETQSAYRWRNDDGSESTATYAAAQDTSDDIAIGTPERLRLGAANDGSEDELLEEAALSLVTEGACKTPVIDATDTYLYCLSGSRIVKVRLSDFAHVDTLTLTNTVSPFTMAIDKSDGYLYIGDFTAPGQIDKVRLSDFTEMTLLSLPGYNGAGSIVIDETGIDHYAYVGMGNGRVFKVNLTTYDVDASAGADINLYSATIDTANGFAYFVSYNSVCVVDKFSLSSFGFVTSVTFDGAEGNCRTSAIDLANGYLYVPTETSKVVKVDLSTFSRIGFVATTPQFLNSIVIDPAGDFAYVGDDSSNPGKIVKIDLSSFTVTTTMTLNAIGERRLEGAVMDSAGDYAYFGVAFTPSMIIKIQLSDFTENDVLMFDPGERSIQGAAAIDTAGGFAYFGTYQSTPVIAKIDLATFERVGFIQPAGMSSLISAAIDTTNGFAYFGDDDSPANIAKVRLSDFTLVDVLTLGAGEDRARSIMIDESEGFAYVGLFGFSGEGKVAKIDLASFTEVDVISFNAGENAPRTAVIDTVNQFIYYGTLGTTCGGCDPGADTYVVKVDIDPSNFARVGSIGLESQGVVSLRTSVIDAANGFAYFADQSGHIAKIDLSGFTYVSKITDSDNVYLASSVIDTANGFAYFASNDSPGSVYKIELSSFTEVDKITFAGADQPFTALLDGEEGYAYFGTNSNPADVVKVSIAPRAQFRLEYGLKTSTCGAISSWTQVPASATSEEWEMSASANVTDGAATTDSAGLTNGNTSFQAGEIHDTTSQASEISLGEAQFTELEFSVQATANASDGEAYCFRLTDAGSATGFTYGQYAEATIGSGSTNDPTLSNAVTMSRLKISTASTVSISFELQNELTGTWTATFPVGFSVTGAMTQGTCSGGGTVDTFAFSGGSRTMTAEKHACSGTLTLSGGTVTTPGTPGLYFITWTNDDPGEGGVAIVDDDQVTVTAQVAASITFDIDTAVTDTESAAPYSVPLGTITTSDTRVSGATDGVNSIWLDLDTNASAGAVITVKNANGANGLVSTSAPADNIDSAGGAMADGTENYGICSISEADTGGNLDDLSPYDGTCAADSETNVVGGLSTTPTDIYDTDGAAISGGRARISVNAAISGSTASHNDYADTLTFIATGTY
jgi:hypothetical protein